MFGVFPLRRQFADEKAPNKLGSPTVEAFFNRIIETKRLGKTRSLGLYALRGVYPELAEGLRATLYLAVQDKCSAGGRWS